MIASRKLRGAKQDRRTLIPYFRERYRRGDRLAFGKYRFNGYDRERDRGHLELADGRWSTMVGKGALSCSGPPVTIALLLVGG